jgi:hypothetical protein
MQLNSFVCAAPSIGLPIGLSIPNKLFIFSLQFRIIRSPKTLSKSHTTPLLDVKSGLLADLITGNRDGNDLYPCSRPVVDLFWVQFTLKVCVIPTGRRYYTHLDSPLPREGAFNHDFGP